MSNIQFKEILLIVILFFYPSFVLSHCPLCTAGTGILAILAKELGVKTEVLGIFIGAFSIALGFWISRLIKKRFPFKTTILLTLSFFTTLFPLRSLFKDIGAINFLNQIYFLDRFILGSIVGAFLMIISPPLSKKLSQVLQGKNIPFQTLLITFALLILVSLLFQIL